MEQTYLLGFDCGTHESKGVICDPDGRVLAISVRSHPLEIPRPGFAEHDPVNSWWKDFKEIVRELLQKTQIVPDKIAAVGISTVMAGITPVDINGDPLRNAILYGIDNRCIKQAEYLNRQIGERRILHHAGRKLDIEMFGPKILWIRENEPDIFARTHKFTMASGFLTSKLTGCYCVDKYSAMAAQPMLNRRTMDWDEDLCRLVCPKEMLPEIVDTSQIIGGVTKAAAQETGLAEGTPVICGTTDAGAEAVSVGVIYPEEMMVMYGSTTFFLYTTRKYNSGSGMWAGDYTIKNLYCNSGGMATTGALISWIRDTMARELCAAEEQGKENAYTILSREARNIPVGSNGLMILPYFMGERMPVNDPLARGMIFGLNLRHTRGDIVHAAYEGIGFGICQNLDLLKRQGANMENIIAVGGGTKSRTWLQIVSDICGIKQTVPEVSFGASYGDALLAGLGTGVISKPDDIKKMVKVKEVIEPDFEKTKEYKKYKSVFGELYNRNRDLMYFFEN
jgi:xylulokinase